MSAELFDLTCHHQFSMGDASLPFVPLETLPCLYAVVGCLFQLEMYLFPVLLFKSMKL